MNDLSHAEIQRCVERSSSPDRTKRVLRAILKRAFDDELLDEEPFRRRVPTHTARKQQVQPWSVPEAQLAPERFRGPTRALRRTYLRPLGHAEGGGAGAAPMRLPRHRHLRLRH